MNSWTPIEQCLREHDNEALDNLHARRLRKRLDEDRGLADYYEAILDVRDIIKEANTED